MLFESVGEGWIFLILLCVGMWTEFCFCALGSIIKKIKEIKKNNKKTIKKEEKCENNIIFSKKPKQKLGKKKTYFNIKIAIFSFAKMLIYGLILLICVYLLDYFDIRMYHILAFGVGICVIKALFVFLQQKSFKI